MNQGKYVFTQLMSVFSRYEFDKCVSRYKGNHGVRHLGCWQQFLCLVFGQMTHRESLRDIVICLKAREDRLYHLGFRKNIALSTLADANQRRNWRIYADFAEVLMRQVSEMPRGKSEHLKHISHSIYALDASLIRICMSVFFWAKYRKTKSGVKIHTLLDVRTMFPRFFYISDGSVNDQQVLKTLDFESGAFYVMDRGYFNLKELLRIHHEEAFYVIRAKVSLRFNRFRSRDKTGQENIVFDQEGKFKIPSSLKDYPEKIRAIKAKDPETGKTIVLLTNNFELKASDIALIYRYRWKIELFFKWIKQHLEIKVFWGESENAVKIQIYTALCAYLIVAIAKEQSKSTQTLNEITQILSVSLFDKVSVNQLLTESATQISKNEPGNQLTIW